MVIAQANPAEKPTTKVGDYNGERRVGPDLARAPHNFPTILPVSDANMFTKWRGLAKEIKPKTFRECCKRECIEKCTLVEHSS